MDLFRLILLIAIAGSAATLLGSLATWWMDESRRLRRYMRRCLGGEPDAVIVAKGRAAGAGFRIESGQAIVLWNGGAKALLYPITALLGAELIVNDQVVARAFRGEPRRALDSIDTNARQVTLRLVFDNPRDPDFELDLWLPQDMDRRDAATPAGVIQEARTWLARSEALMRLPPPAPTVQIDSRVDTEPDDDMWEDDLPEETAPEEPQDDGTQRRLF